MGYNEAKEFIKEFNFKNYNQFKQWAKSEKCPKNLPHRPDLTYKNKGWINAESFMK